MCTIAPNSPGSSASNKFLTGQTQQGINREILKRPGLFCYCCFVLFWLFVCVYVGGFVVVVVFETEFLCVALAIPELIL